MGGNAKRFGPGEGSWPGKMGGEAAGDDDVEGHAMARINIKASGDEEDTEGHAMSRINVKASDDEDEDLAVHASRLA